MPDAARTPWTLRKWPQRIGLTLVVLIIATPIVLVLVIAAQVASDPLGLKGGGEPYAPRAACVDLGNWTAMTRPTRGESDPVWDARMIKRYGRVMADVAAWSRPGSMRDELRAAVRVTRSGTWASVDDWQANPAVLAVADHCARLRPRSP